MVRERIDQAIKDLRCVTPGELSYRAWETVLRKSGIHQRIYRTGWMGDETVFRAFGDRFTSRKELCQYLRSRKNVTFFFSPDDKEKYAAVLNKVFPSQRELLLESAEKILGHRFDLLGQRFEFNHKIDWHFAGAGKRWPLVHWSELHVGSRGGIGDVRPLWELNRHQHFYALGRAYWRTGDERYVGEFASQLSSWLSDNPPELGINWQSNLEIAIRSISWLWAFHFFLHSRELDDDILFDWVRAFVHSAYHLYQQIPYSWHCMHNNHLIGDAAGLLLIAQIFPELIQSKAWRRRALKILYGELSRQVYDDGVNWEQAISYHRFVLYLYLLVAKIESLNGNTVPPLVWSYIEKMFEFLLWICKPDGSAPMVGDSDDSRVVWLGNEPVKDLRPLLAAGAVLFENGDHKFVAGQLSEETLWLLGPDAINCWDKIQKRPPDQTFRSFTKGGFYIARSGWCSEDSYLMFKNGPHSTFHAHADQLHIELSACGKDLLVDPGTYAYNNGGQWRDFFRDTRAHNTVVINGQSQSTTYRSFRWLKVASPLEVEACAGRYVQWIMGGHTGYRRLADPVTHLRGILYIKGEYAVVFDEFLAGRDHNYKFYFHYPPGRCDIIGDRCEYSRLDGSGGLIIYPAHSKQALCNIIEGKEKPQVQGWISYSYGMRKPAPVSEYMAEVNGAWHTGFVLWPLGPDIKAPDFLKSEAKMQMGPIVFTAGHNNVIDTICYAGGAGKVYEIGRDITTDAATVFYRDDTGGRFRRLFAVKGTQLSIGNTFKLSGSWRYLEINIQERKAFFTGDIPGDIKLTSDFISNLGVSEGLEVRQTQYNTWVIRKKMP